MAVLGWLIVVIISFCAGYLATSSVLEKVKKHRKYPFNRDRSLLWKTQSSDILIERKLEIMSILGGVFSVVLAIILLVTVREDLKILVIIGFGFAGFLFGTISYGNYQAAPKVKITPTISQVNTKSGTPFVNESREPKEQLENRLKELTDSPIWDWDQFRGILICLGMLGEGRYIPASRRPDRVSINGLLSTCDELMSISTQKQGRETSRAVLVDRERSSLVISGKTVIGSSEKVSINMGTEPGREIWQVPILTIHVHPSKASEAGLSDMDYISFLTDPRQIIMMVCIQGGVLFTMKTTATPRRISEKIAKRWISDTRREITSIWLNLHLPNAVLGFNKAICTEFGLILFKTTDKENNIADRINVTEG